MCPPHPQLKASSRPAARPSLQDRPDAEEGGHLAPGAGALPRGNRDAGGERRLPARPPALKAGLSARPGQGRGPAGRDRRRGRGAGRRPTTLGEEGKGSGPVEPDALTAGAGAAAAERIATGEEGETEASARQPPFFFSSFLAPQARALSR